MCGSIIWIPHTQNTHISQKPRSIFVDDRPHNSKTHKLQSKSKAFISPNQHNAVSRQRRRQQKRHFDEFNVWIKRTKDFSHLRQPSVSLESFSLSISHPLGCPKTLSNRIPANTPIHILTLNWHYTKISKSRTTTRSLNCGACDLI